MDTSKETCTCPCDEVTPREVIVEDMTYEELKEYRNSKDNEPMGWDPDTVSEGVGGIANS